MTGWLGGGSVLAPLVHQEVHGSPFWGRGRGRAKGLQHKREPRGAQRFHAEGRDRSGEGILGRRATLFIGWSFYEAAQPIMTQVAYRLKASQADAERSTKQKKNPGLQRCSQGWRVGAL